MMLAAGSQIITLGMINPTVDIDPGRLAELTGAT